MFSVECTDSGNAAYYRTMEDLQPYIKEIESQSVLGGEVVATIHTVVCTGWSIVASEVFRGELHRD